MTIRTVLNDATPSRRLVHTRRAAMSPGPNRFLPDSARATPTATAPAVYLVDGDRPTLEYLSDQLTCCGYWVHGFESFEHYIRFPRSTLPSCLIVDADASGQAAWRLQLDLEVGSQVPVILTSANPDIATVVRSIKAGALDFLMKPLSMDTLICAVRAAIEQSLQHGQARAARARVASRMASLTPRESQLLPLLVSGLLNKQSAARLGISEITVKVHRRHIMEKLQASSLAELVRMTAHLDLDLIDSSTPVRTHAKIPGNQWKQGRQCTSMLL